MFPVTRLRRLRRTPALRDLVRETRLHASDFIYPLFVLGIPLVVRRCVSYCVALSLVPPSPVRGSCVASLIIPISAFLVSLSLVYVQSAQPPVQ